MAKFTWHFGTISMVLMFQWAREALEDWGETQDYTNYTDSELINSWTQISGDTEFFKIEQIELHN